MNFKQRLSLITFTCLSAAALLGCQGGNNKQAYTGINDVTITFNAGIGRWRDTHTSIKSLTIRKGYTWGFLKEHVKEELRNNVLNGGLIASGSSPIIHEGDVPTGEIWHVGDNEEYISSDYAFTAPNTILNVNYDAAALSFTVVWDEHVEPDEPHHHVEGQTGRSADVSGKVGMTWGEIADNYIPIANDGYEFETFRHYKNEKGTVIDDTYVIQNNDILTAVYNDQAPESFENDSWTLFASVADAGFDYMANNTHEHGGYNQEYVENGNTFVGLTRHVQIGSADYKVRVIGEKVDNYSANKKATLTFEFVNAVSQNRSYDSVDHNQNNFSDSMLSDYLNNKFFFTLPKDLQDVIRPVNKVTCLGLSSGTSQYRTSREAIFPLSLKELNFNQVLPTGHTVELEGVGDSHSNCYQLYNTTNPVELAYYRSRAVLKKDGSTGDKVAYWVRSPDVDTSQYAWCVTSNGSIDTKPTDVTEVSGVACGFCIGAEDAGTTVTFDVASDGGHWSDFTTDSVDITLENSSMRFSDALDQLDKTPGKDGGYQFAYWQDKNGHPIKNSRMVDASFTAYARFTNGETHLLRSLNDRFEIDVAEFVDEQEVNVNISPLSYSDEQGNSYRVHDYPSSDQITLIQSGEYELEEGSDYIYDQTTGSLTIFQYSTYGSIDILIDASQIVCGWSRIIDFAKLDEESDLDGELVSTVFNVGDFTYVTIGGVSHKVRMIDFGHDTISGKINKAAITFDFVTAISDLNKNVITTSFADNDVELANMKYEGNTLYNAVNNIYNSMPSNIRTYMKKVNKDSTYHNGANLTKGSLATYLFPLSLKEMNVNFADAEISEVYTGLDEGSPYAFYSDCAYATASEKLAKFDANGMVVDSCYLRSGSYFVASSVEDPYFDYSYTSAYLNKIDETSMSLLTANDAYTGAGSYHTMLRAFAPGFCI